ncbi:MAG: hypothetical protein EBU66_15480 [Bacteroidetes bacterium]|nr:hypothetical protein [bacterium]NBP66049.1 hypothetical protein [Bacteroidota bacterium]
MLFFYQANDYNNAPNHRYASDIEKIQERVDKEWCDMLHEMCNDILYNMINRLDYNKMLVEMSVNAELCIKFILDINLSLITFFKKHYYIKEKYYEQLKEQICRAIRVSLKSQYIIFSFNSDSQKKSILNLIYTNTCKSIYSDLSNINFTYNSIVSYILKDIYRAEISATLIQRKWIWSTVCPDYKLCQKQIYEFSNYLSEMHKKQLN